MVGGTVVVRAQLCAQALRTRLDSAGCAQLGRVGDELPPATANPSARAHPPARAVATN